MSQKKKTLSEETSEHLMDLIVKQKIYKPGEKLPNERQLATQMDVSRTTIREAIKLLNSKGIIKIHRGVGNFISSVPGVSQDPFGFSLEPNKKKLLMDWYQVRIILEPEVMEYVAQNATDEELSQCEKIQSRERALIEKCDDKFIQLDIDFHCALASATHNVALIRLLPALLKWEDYRKIVVEYNHTNDAIMKNAHRGHNYIMEFLKHRDGHGASLAMRYHILRAIEEITKVEVESK